MKHRIYTDTLEIAYHLSKYLYYHPALEHFIDRSDPLWRSKYDVYLTNGSIFAFGPWNNRTDLGVPYDKYYEYSKDYCPLDILLAVIEDIVKN